jgi:hypothetical protein
MDRQHFSWYPHNRINLRRYVMNAKASRVAGLFLLASVILVWIALAIVMVGDVEISVSDSERALQQLTTGMSFHITELVFDVLSGFALIGFGAMLYLVLESRARTAALLSAVFIGVSGLIIAVHDMGNFSVAFLVRDWDATGEGARLALAAAVRSQLLTAKWGVTISSAALIVGMVILNGLFVRKPELPTVLGIVGLVAAVCATVAMVPAWINAELMQLGYLLYLPMLVWQIWLGIVLIRGRLAGDATA